MKYGIISDIHSNLEAFNTVIKFLNGKVDTILHVGDIVGYGADPSSVIKLVREKNIEGVLGNHDSAVAGIHDAEDFNEYARRAVEWTKKQLKNDEIAFLRSLPYIIKKKNFLLVHSTPSEPERWRYLTFVKQAEEEFNHFNEQICFIGHSHQPVIIIKNPSGEIEVEFNNDITIEEDKRYIINVGSVGQPRDGDPRASVVIYDEEKKIVKFYRLEYDIETARDKIIDAGLPEFLGLRLMVGR